MEIDKPLAWEPDNHVYMRKYIPNFLDFVESYIIKYNNISPSGVIPPDVLINNIEKIEEGAAVMGAFDHLVHVKALGSKECNHGVGLVMDESELSNSILGALGYIAATINEGGQMRTYKKIR